MRRNSSTKKDLIQLVFAVISLVIALISGLSVFSDANSLLNRPVFGGTRSPTPTIPSSPTPNGPTPGSITPEAAFIAEIAAQGTRIAALEDTLEIDPQNAVTLILLERDIKELSEDAAQIQDQLNELRTLVIGTWIALLLVLAGAITPFAINKFLVSSNRSNSQE